MSNEPRRRGHTLHRVEWQNSSWSKWYLASFHVDELACKLWSIVFPCPLQRLHCKDALERFSVSHAGGAGFTEDGTVGAGVNWQKHMLAITELDQNHWRGLQQFFWFQAFQQWASSPVFSVCELNLQNGGCCVLHGVGHFQRCCEPHFHANVEKANSW